MRKKFISLITAALMLLTVLSAGALAAGTRTAEAVTSSPSNESVIAFWDFETDPIEDGWQFIDADGDGRNWEWIDNETHAHSGNYSIQSNSGVGNMNPDNWAITPTVVIPANGYSMFEYYVKNYSSFYTDTYRIYVGTSADIDSMEPITNDIVLSGNEYTCNRVDLSAFAGQTVYIAIRHYNCTDEWKFNFDDISVINTNEAPETPYKSFYFETADDIAEWTFLDDDGDGYTWNWSYKYPQNLAEYEGVGALYSESYVNDFANETGFAVTPDNWAISPLLNAPDANARLTLFASSYGDYNNNEHFAVYAGTDANIETMTEIIPETEATAHTMASANYQRYEADLSQFAGQNIYIAIRHFNSSNMLMLMVDQVEIWGEDESTQPDVINEIRVDGFTVPEWGENPDYEVTVPDDANYAVSYCDWNWEFGSDGDVLTEDGVFDNEDYSYFMFFQFEPLNGCTFADNVTLYINGSTELVGDVMASAEEAFAFSASFNVTKPVDDDPFAIHEVHVTGWGTPIAGVAGVDNMFLAAPADAPYYIIFGGWRDETDNQQMWSEDHIFIAGHEYSEGCQIWAEDGYHFAEDCVFYADNTTVELDQEWCYVDETDNWICYMNSAVVTCEATSDMLGDIDLDSDVDIADSILSLRYVLGLIGLHEAQLNNAEVDGNDGITVSDSLLVMRRAMELIQCFPIEEQNSLAQ